MDKLTDLPIDWANVNWPYVTVLALIVFICTLIGTALSFRRIFFGAVLTALLFAAAYVFWTYYPHGLPLPTKAQEAAAPLPPAPPPPATTTTPIKPDNPVTTISPPADTQQR